MKVVIRVINLITRLIILFPQIKIKRNKAVKAFEEELINMGISLDSVKELSKTYKKSIDFREITYKSHVNKKRSLSY